MAQVLRQLPPVNDPNLLVGANTVDDAAVYRLNGELALVQTVDFFPPVVDDPYSFGAIAAANALSDIYAMGARPLIAMNIVCFPVALPKEILVEILRGSSDKAGEAGVTIVGGHTIDDEEPKYGLAVTGLVDPGKEVTNATARPGDRLILTKPLGTGIIITAAKGNSVAKETVEKAIALMSTLNKAASEVMLRVGVGACTDITGFGLLGHLQEMVQESGVGARVHLSQVPVIPEAWPLVAKGIVPGGTGRNLHSLAHALLWDPQISEEVKMVLCDPQTSGGLLFSVAREKAKKLLASLKAAGVVHAALIGEMVENPKGKIQVLP